MIVDIFFRYLIGHLVGDFVLQPYWLAIEKRKGWKGLLIHVSVVTIATTVIIGGTMPRWGLWITVLFAVHLFIDQFRTFVFTNNGKGRGLLLLAADQLAHVISLVLLSSWATGASVSGLQEIFTAPLSPVNIRSFVVGLVIIAVWVAPIIEIEVIVALASFKSSAGKGVAPIGLSDRTMGGAERILALLLFSGGWGWLSPVVFLPRSVWLWHASGQRENLIPKMSSSIIVTALLALLIFQIY